ncbi:MAG: hypothetical protein NTX11_00510 [Candidatus Saccharibacteria bacterium]|nr:hypothetical protein [Candidatus Saccharibacteria bacterium]
MPESKATKGTFTFFPEHDLTELADHVYPAIQSGKKGKVLVLAAELVRDNANAAQDLGPVITQNSVDMIAVFDGVDGKFTEENV